MSSRICATGVPVSRNWSCSEASCEESPMALNRSRSSTKCAVRTGAAHKGLNFQQFVSGFSKLLGHILQRSTLEIKLENKMRFRFRHHCFSQ
jgi:hypothetical protein